MEEEPRSLVRRTRFPSTVYHRFDASKLSHLPFTVQTSQISGAKSMPESIDSRIEPNCVQTVPPTQKTVDSDASNQSSTRHKLFNEDSHEKNSLTSNQLGSRSLNIITSSIKHSIIMSLKFRGNSNKSRQESSLAESLNNRGKKVASEEMIDENMIDLSKLFLGQKFALGAHSQLYHGIYADEPVAVKVIRVPDDEDGSLRARLEKQFMKEAVFLSRLRHENVIKFVGACQKPPVFCIVTEYLREGSLRLYLLKPENKSLPIQKVISMALDIVRGMEYIHSNGVVHRDLKPENILITGDFHLKVSDFGIACEESHCHLESADPGTYRWMAPEMIKRKKYGRKVDVYAFGLVLWELLAGNVPFKDMTPIQAAFAVVNKNFRPNFPADCPPAMKALIEQCWCPKPDKRPEFSQIVKILEEFESSLARDGTLEHPLLSIP
ncbi:serine/threonine/tyrosine-protein kinase HT1-like [Primulina huaijiensis]|uniref:serine/threonine/tyrosine-protein kinase HT1-like n=1 Tax=Primulina huaijiensis TaxID=1492673 RepID=UPI003CC73E8F